MKKSRFKVGEYLVTEDGRVFVHDGFVNGDGLGVVIGEDEKGIVRKSSGSGNWQVEPSAVHHIAGDIEKEAFFKKLRNQVTIENW